MTCCEQSRQEQKARAHVRSFDRGRLTPEQAVVDLVTKIGLGGVAFYAFLRMLDFLRWFVEGERQQRKEISEALKVINQRQVDHDTDIEEMETKIDAVSSAQAGAFNKLTQSIDTNTEVTRATIKSYQTLEENFVQSYDAASKTIGLTGNDVKENSNKNTEKIINEVKALAADDSPIRADIKHIAKDIIEAFQTLDQKNSNLEIDNQMLKLAKESVEAQFEQYKADHPAVEVEKDKTDPLAIVLTGALSPSDGEANRKIAGVVEPPQPEPPTPSNAVDPVTGEDWKVA